MKGLGGAYAWPFFSIIIGIRVVDVLRNLLLAAMPGRYWQEVVEVPVMLIALFGVAKLIVIRWALLFPHSPTPPLIRLGIRIVFQYC